MHTKHKDETNKQDSREHEWNEKRDICVDGPTKSIQKEKKPKTFVDSPQLVLDVSMDLTLRRGMCGCRRGLQANGKNTVR